VADYRDEYWTQLTTGQVLKKAGKTEEALAAFLAAVAEVERQAAVDGTPVAPAPYREAAVLYRRLGDLIAERSLLERFACQPHPHGATVSQLLERLKKVRAGIGITGQPARLA
jgi:hypothetical protein